jgi:hypothetical protein
MGEKLDYRAAGSKQPVPERSSAWPLVIGLTVLALLLWALFAGVSYQKEQRMRRRASELEAIRSVQRRLTPAEEAELDEIYRRLAVRKVDRGD